MTKYLMGIDNGSTVIKAGLFDLNGHERGVASVTCEAASPRPGWYERDIDKLWAANVRAISGVIQKTGVDPKDILAVSLTGHGNCAHLVDERGNGVRNTIEGADTRARDYVDRWMNDGTFEKLHPKNMQALWPALSICVLAWLRDNEPETLKKAKWFLMVKDYARMKLTGVANLEYTDSSGGGIINTRERRIDTDMLDDAGISDVAGLFPPLVNATDNCGGVTKAAAMETGLLEGTPVAAGCYDIDTAALATGVLDENYLNVIVGSWANNQYVSARPIVDKEFFSTTNFAIADRYLMLEGSPSGAMNLEWFVRTLLPAERTQLSALGGSVYDICNYALSETNPKDSDVLFLPFVYGSSVSADASGTFLGLTGRHERTHIIRSVFEGICFSHKWHIDKIKKHGPLPGGVRIAGGAARSAEWRQVFADVLDMPIEVTKATEMGALGAAMCAAVAAGVYPGLDEAAKAMVHVKSVTFPDAENIGVYERKYENYLKAVDALKAYWT